MKYLLYTVIVLGLFWLNISSATPDDGLAYTATFELNWADGIESDTLVWTSVIAPDIIRDWWEVLWWSINSGSNIAEYSVWDTIVLDSDTTFYAITSKTYFATFESNWANSIVFTTWSCKAYNTQTYCEEWLHTITICDPQDLSECITMMDTNLWAITNDITSTWSYWYHYQWWNNYWFSLYDSVEWITTDVTVDTSAYWPWNWYDNDIFRSITSAPYDWSSPQNNDLWWWSSDNQSNWRWYPVINPTDRQWPCPDWYHVPSAWEWSMLLKYWRDMYMTGLSLDINSGLYSFSGSIAREQFQNYFKIPFAGYHSVYDGSVSRLGEFAGLWSSSIYGNNAYYFTMEGWTSNIPNYGRAHGISLRCFKNSALSITLSTPGIMRDDWTILGWSTNSGSMIPEYGAWDVLQLDGDIVLYAITQREVTLSFDSNWWTAINPQTKILYSTMFATWTEPSDPARAGSIFSGWYESWSNIEFDFQNTEITSDITLYAHWDCDVQNGYQSNGDVCILSGEEKTILEQNPGFQYDTITIYRPSSLDNDFKNSPSKYVIMDRNLWSTSAWTWAEAYWYYYQYGNNYWFSGDQWLLWNTIYRNDINVDLTLYWLGTANGPYYDTVFVRWRKGGTSYQDWATTSNENIWWNSAIKESERQWPCPSWYHVPTIDEWSDVVAYRSQWSWWGSMDVSSFINDLKLTLQWELGRTSGSVNNLWSQWLFRVTTPEYESDPSDPHKAYAFKITANSYDINFSDNRVNGYPVRCFRDDDTIYTITYDDGVAQASVFSDQVYTGMRWDYMNAFSGWIPVWDGEKLFDWWYIENNWDYELVDPTSLQIQSDMMFYAKWSSCAEYDECVVPTDAEQVHVDTLEVYFAIDSWHIDHYTLMDRNLWATKAWTWVDSYGAFFQWWNNYHFSNTWAFENVSTSRVNAQGYWPDNYYNSSTFISGNADWSSKTNNNLWWNTTDTPEARRWPCPQWYHVPSASEWLDIHNSWSWVTYENENGCVWGSNCAIKIKNDLLLPSAWRIKENWQYGFPTAGSYWTSTPVNGKSNAYGFYYNQADTSNDRLQPNNSDPRARARSVRCVKDVNTVPIDIKLNGWEKWAISIYSGNLHYLTNPTRSWYEFEWWYKDLARGIKIEDWEYISPTVTTLYAKWSGEVYDIIYTATFEANGATSVWSTGLSCSVSGFDASGQWCAVVAPTITRDWWNILGWSTDSGASIAQYAVWDDIYLYEDMTYYAITSLVPYYVRHYLKDVWTGTYTLQDTETLSWTTNEVLFLSGFARDDIPCARYMNGSLSGSETWPWETIDYTSISPDGATVIYLYYTRSVFSVELTWDIWIGFLDWAGPFECWEVVEINAYPIEWYHFDMRELLEWEIDDSG